MKYSTKLSDTVHVMVLIAINQEKSLSSASIAESVHTNPGFVRQLMLKLKKAGLMTSVAGHARPSLSKPADQITLLDIYKAVEGDKPLLHLDTHTNPDCGVGINIQLSLQGFYNEIQKTAEEKMNTITLQDIINTYYQRTSMQNDLQNYMTGEYSFSDTVRNWTKGKHLISTNCSAAKQLPQFSSYLNIKYLSNVSIKQIFVRPICHKYQNIRICEGNL